jgi:ADP-ribosylglycohydrolase
LPTDGNGSTVGGEGVKALATEARSGSGLESRARGCLVGAAIGDALGGATEGRAAEDVVEHYGGFVEGVVQSMTHVLNDRPLAPFHKGDGHVTDDTLVTRALVRVYAQKRDHLDAYDVERLLVPELIGERIWIPELGREELLLHRLALAEKWLVLRLHYGHVDPREAGVGNIVNCGAAMYSAPVGIANAGDPDGAYREALDVAGAHQSSYGREAAGVFAAAVAEALRPGADVGSVVAACLDRAEDGTHAAIEAVCERARSLDGWRDGGLAELRAAVEPYDTVGPVYFQPGLDARRPSRVHAIEELPVALGLLVATNGDFAETVLGGTNYGRDADSIASMGGAIAGALAGRDGVRADWADEVAAASRIDLDAPGTEMAAVAREIFARDDAAHAARRASFGALDGRDGCD